MKLTIKKIAIVLFTVLQVSACGGMQSRTANLLAADYHNMTMVDLHTYYRQLSDQLGLVTYAVRQSANSLWKSSDDVKGLAGLRKRWNEVNSELLRRQNDSARSPKTGVRNDGKIPG
ncbi:MAG: hypothetical protein GXP59_08105 [Deltaproteobacteria bacterium]|nr:hypothetical protein [Deltaproteobacteria bacterium]